MKSNISIHISNFSRIHVYMLIFILGIVPVKFVSSQENGKLTFVVSPQGSDDNLGTIDSPLATLEAARDLARKSGAEKKRILVMPGNYYLSKTLELDNRENGLTIEADSYAPVTIYGGSLITGWQQDGEGFWRIDLPGVKEGTKNCRSLIVNGRLAERARFPSERTLFFRNEFNLQPHGGEWANKTREEDYNKLQYRSNDLPASLDINNAEVRIYHMWNESLTGILRNDTINHEFVLSSHTLFPLGSFGKKDYVIYNTREGMTRPGTWYLDRTNGQLVYWPLADEKMSEAKVIVPEMERIIRITGDLNQPVEDIIIRNLKFQSADVPLKSVDAACSRLDGALSMINAQNCILEDLEILNVGGNGISALDLKDCRIVGCHVHHVGGSGILQSGANLFCARNHIHNVGLYYPSAIGLSAMGEDQHVYRNEIHDIPYCGMNVCCIRNLVEENLIYRVMLELQDGAAIYVGGGYGTILRGNVVRDIKSVGDGYGISSYYLDEGTHDCIIEQNISIGVSRPVHNHIAFNSTIHDNTFITDGDMVLSFQSSANFTFENNRLIVPGKIEITQPNGINLWKDNKIFRDGNFDQALSKAFVIESAMPEVPLPARKTMPVEVIHSNKAPVIDGEIAKDEWPGRNFCLDRELTRRPCSGRTVFMKSFYDDKYLYIGVIVDMYKVENLCKGEQWGKNDGIEISLIGNCKKNPVTFIIRSYANGVTQSITDGSATAKAAENLGKLVQYSSKVNKTGWVGEWAIPLDAIGLCAKTNQKVAFNMCAFINEYGNWHCWEGTQGESWQADRAGILLFK